MWKVINWFIYFNLFNILDKNSKTLEENHSAKIDNRTKPAGNCQPKYEVTKKSMADHLSNGYSNTNCKFENGYLGHNDFETIVRY